MSNVWGENIMIQVPSQIIRMCSTFRTTTPIYPDGEMQFLCRFGRQQQPFIVFEIGWAWHISGVPFPRCISIISFLLGQKYFWSPYLRLFMFRARRPRNEPIIRISKELIEGRFFPRHFARMHDLKPNLYNLLTNDLLHYVIICLSQSEVMGNALMEIDPND
jgi:hypothetical protein